MSIKCFKTFQMLQNIFPQSSSKVGLFSSFYWPRTIYFMYIPYFLVTLAPLKIMLQTCSYAQNLHNTETFQTSHQWILCCNQRFSAIIRENVAWRHYFGLRGPISKYYYGKAIWDRNLIFVAIFLICNVLNFVYWKLNFNAFRNITSSGGSFPPLWHKWTS